MKILNVGDIFPSIKGKTPSGLDVIVPDGSALVSVVVVGFERDALLKALSWKKTVDELRETHPEVAYFEVPMVEKLYTMLESSGSEVVETEVSSSYDYIVSYSGPLKEYKEMFGVTDTKEAYVFVLNSSQTIVYRNNGFLSPEGEFAFINAIEKSLRGKYEA